MCIFIDLNKVYHFVLPSYLHIDGCFRASKFSSLLIIHKLWPHRRMRGIASLGLACTRRFSTGASTFRIVEVGARDGLQNEKVEVRLQSLSRQNLVSTTDKLELISRLVASGLRTVEATAFVSAKWVPQMGDHDAIVAGLPFRDDVSFPVLVPNLAGLDNAVCLFSLLPSSHSS